MLARTPQEEKFARARERVAAGAIPRCAWANGHRYDLLKIENGMRVEVCMDCGGRPRIYPANLSSKHSKPYDLATGKAGEWPRLSDAKIIEFPPTAQDQQIGDGSNRL